MNKDAQRGERIKEERARLALSQQKAADAVGVRREMWAKYEAGAEPGAEALAGMRRLGVDVDYVLDGKTLKERAAEAAAGMPERLQALRLERGIDAVVRVAGLPKEQWMLLEMKTTPDHGYPAGLMQRLIEAFKLDPTAFILGQHRSITTSDFEEVVLIENYRACSALEQEALRHQAAFLAARAQDKDTKGLTPEGKNKSAEPTAPHEKRKKTP